MTPRKSGLVKGTRKFKPRAHVIQGGLTKHGMPDVHLSDVTAIKRDVWDYDPDWEFEYSRRELILIAEKILLLDVKPRCDDPVWLNADQLLERARREIFTGVGTPDPSIVAGMYWRSHPNGRHVNSDEQRKKRRASYYR